MKVKELRKGYAPIRSTDGAGGYDIRYCGDPDEEKLLRTGCTEKFGTGFAVEIPAGYVGLIRPRSGLGFKHGVTVLAGVIDSDYRGEVKVALHKVSSPSWIGCPVTINDGDRIAQLVIVPCYQGGVELVGELDDTDRGAGGFGSTGK